VIESEIERLLKLINKDNFKLNNPKFMNNASEEIIKKVAKYYAANLKNLKILQKELEINK